jgi:nitrate ABC transporter ATP-binding subunit
MAGYVELFQVSKSFPTPAGPLPVVQDFNLNIAEGEFVSLIGHSGCGKSTVLSMIAGLTIATAGGIVVAKREIAGPGPDRAVVFQSPSLLPWLTALGNVELGLASRFPEASRADRRELAEYYLALLGLGGSSNRHPRELSQGMQQRVGIARALALAPKMLLLDEPFGMLDSLTRMELQEVLLGILARERVTALIVTHDVDEALFLSDRVVMMTSGPNATIGDVLPVPFERPRDRASVLEHPRYYDCRAHLLGFLEREDHRKHAPPRESAEPATVLGAASVPA